MTQTFPSGGAMMWAARVSMVFLAILIASVGFASGNGLVLVVTLVLAVLLLVTVAVTFRNAYIIDGTRVGHRNGWTGSVKEWIDAGDIAVTTANYDNPDGSGFGAPTLVYWTRSGGSSGVSAAVTSKMLTPANKQAIERASVNGELRPFAIPVSTLGPDAKKAFEQFSPPRRS